MGERQIPLICGADSDRHHGALCKAVWGQMQARNTGFQPWDSITEAPVSSRPAAEVWKQMRPESDASSRAVSSKWRASWM